MFFLNLKIWTKHRYGIFRHINVAVFKLHWQYKVKFLIFFTLLNKYVIFIYKYIKKMTPEAERFNGWAAMLGFVAAVGAYVTTGQIIPGWF